MKTILYSSIKKHKLSRPVHNMSNKEGTVGKKWDQEPNETIFSKMCTGQFKTDPVYEDEYVLVIKDINPQAPIHLLILPKKTPIGKLQDSTDDDASNLGHLLVAAGKVAKKLDVVGGYRLVINEGTHGQQSINYLHIHFFAGTQCKWPPL